MRFTFGEIREFLDWINRMCTPSRYVFYYKTGKLLEVVAVPTVSTPPIQVATYTTSDPKEFDDLIKGLRERTFKVFQVDDFVFSTESEK